MTQILLKSKFGVKKKLILSPKFVAIFRGVDAKGEFFLGGAELRNAWTPLALGVATALMPVSSPGRPRRADRECGRDRRRRGEQKERGEAWTTPIQGESVRGVTSKSGDRLRCKLQHE